MLDKCYTIIDGCRHFNFATCAQYLTFIGRQKYGPQFRLHNEDREIIHKLICYAIRDEESCASYGIDLRKGILLNGPVGCGKTSLMNLIRTFHYKHLSYPVISTREIAHEYNRDGFSVIHKYGRSPKIYCFDDLGIEQPVKHFGNECNTTAEILLHRYDMQINYGIVTHATTNLNADELDNFYGNRVRSRLRTMFNLVSFPESTKDKRK